jgi:hypothetical protein
MRIKVKAVEVGSCVRNRCPLEAERQTASLGQSRKELAVAILVAVSPAEVADDDASDLIRMISRQCLTLFGHRLSLLASYSNTAWLFWYSA